MNYQYRDRAHEQNFSLKETWQHLEQLRFNGKFRIFVELLQHALLGLKRRPFTSFMCVCTLALVLMLFGAFLVLFENVEAQLDQVSAGQEIAVFLDDELEESQFSSVASAVKEIIPAADIELVSKEEALVRFQEMLGGGEELLEGLRENNPLPYSLDVRFSDPELDVSALEQWSESIGAIAGVESVQYDGAYLKEVKRVLNRVRWIGGGLLFVLFLFSTFIMLNVIRLALYSRMDELNILSLVGAPWRYSAGPSILEGVLQGAGAAVLALLGLNAIVSISEKFLSAYDSQIMLRMLPVSGIFALIVAGVAVGLLGSYLATRASSI